MDIKNKGLADNNEGDIILNESGTSLIFDKAEENAEAQLQDEEVDSIEPETTDPATGHA